jgi:hypothetical protein
MHPKFKKRFAQMGPITGRTVSIGSEDDIEKTSVRDAALLLSIADICKSEIKTGGLANIWRDDLTLPKFPCLGEESLPDQKFLAPRTESLVDFLSNSGRSFCQRTRSVSIDSPKCHAMNEDDEGDRSQSPIMVSPEPPFLLSSPHSPVTHRRVTPRKHSLRLSSKAIRESKEGRVSPLTPVTEPISPATQARCKKSLQGPFPKGALIKRIYRKKFSWKNLPELEQFLIANREEYLRHSAQNYTIQQKQYNNRLTERLLELATEHGYLFDEREFSFVVVRDRIRCYYKSFVQSAKKRGVLMGYAARKAGLLSDKELEQSKPGRIIEL